MITRPGKPSTVLVDGTPLDAATDWPLDRGLQYGDGVFETMVVRKGRIRFEALHRQRLAHGCERLKLGIAQAPVWEQAASLARTHGDAVLKLLVTRGAAVQRGYGISGLENARWVLYVYPPALPDVPGIPGEIRVVTLKAQLGENPALAGIKHCNRLEQVLARIELQAIDAYEGLVSSGSGRLISGTMSNVFLATESGLVTPVLDQCGVAGVLRAVALREAAAMGIEVRVADLPMSAVDHCQGLFLTNVRLGVLPATQVNGRPVRIGDELRALAQRVATLAE